MTERSAPGQVVVSAVERLRQALAGNNLAAARAAALELDRDESRDLLESSTPDELTTLFDQLGDETFAELINLLDDGDAADVLARMAIADAADVLEEIDPDDATDLLAEFTDAQAERILVAMEPAEAAEIRELLAYPPDSAGGIMTPAYVAIDPSLRADQAVAALRRVAEEAETVNYVYVIDPEERLLGVLSLHRLVLTRPETPVRELMVLTPVTVSVDTDQEAAARLLIERNLLAIPVLDLDGRLVGIITSDDIADVLVEEATEDIERLGGSQPLEESYLRAKPSLLFRKRIVWLMVLFMAQFVTVSILDHYTTLLAQATVLSLFIPILIGTGGNVGSQTVTTIIRSMAVGEASTRHIWTILRKEMTTGLALGAVMAALMFVRALLTDDGSVDVGITVAVTILAIALWAATVGAILPLVLSRVRVDPAVVSAPFISSLVDGTGLIIYFTVAQFTLNLSN